MTKKEWAKETNIADRLDNLSAQLGIISQMIKDMKKDLPADKDPSN
jgi:Tfp pilus assembly protein PilO